MEAISEIVKRFSAALLQLDAIAGGAITADYNVMTDIMRSLGPLAYGLTTVALADTVQYQAIASANATTIRGRLEEIYFLASLAPAMWKVADPTSSMELKRIVNLTADDNQAGVMAEAEQLKQLRTAGWLINLPIIEPGKLVAYRGRQLLESALSGSVRAMAAIDPDQELHGEYDAAHRASVVSQIVINPSLNAEADASANIRNVIGTASYVRHDGACYGHWVRGNANLAAENILTVNMPCMVVIDFTCDMGRAFDVEASELIAASGVTAQVSLAAITLACSNGGVVKEVFGRLPSTRRFVVTIPNRGTDNAPTAVSVAITGHGNATAVTGFWNAHFAMPTDFGAPRALPSGVGEQSLRSVLGDVDPLVLDQMDLIEANTYLRTLGTYDQFCLNGDAAYNNERDIRSVLNAAAVSMKLADGQFTSKPIWTAEFWLAGRSTTTASQAQWRRLYQRFLHLLPVVETAARANEQFVTRFAQQKLGLNT